MAGSAVSSAKGVTIEGVDIRFLKLPSCPGNSNALSAHGLPNADAELPHSNLSRLTITPPSPGFSVNVDSNRFSDGVSALESTIMAFSQVLILNDLYVVRRGKRDWKG